MTEGYSFILKTKNQKLPRRGLYILFYIFPVVKMKFFW